MRCGGQLFGKDYCFTPKPIFPHLISFPILMQVAIIDCGTNTFTLSLFENQPDGSFKRIDKDRHYVELAAESVDCISPQAFERALEAFRSFRAFLKRYPDAEVRALGTAALRRASNSQDLVDAAFEVSGIVIQVISGEEEAHLIYRGVRQAAPLSERPSLLMDIGGGSVEFIIANRETVFWSKSYPVGLAVLYEKFQKSDPLLPQDRAALQAFLETELADFLTVLEEYDMEHFIGASGSFDMLDKLAGTREEGASHSYIPIDDFLSVGHQLVSSNLEQRLNIPNLKPTRAKLSVMSIFLISFIQQQPPLAKIRECIVSDHAMREGMVERVLQRRTL